MVKNKNLEDYYFHGFPDLVNSIIEGDLKLAASISEQPKLYFFPISISFAEAIPKKFSDETDKDEKKFLAKSGKYEICDIGYVIQKLEKIHEFESNPDSLGRKRPLKKLIPKQLLSSEGEKGCLVEKKWNGNLGSYLYNFVQIPFARILIEEVSPSDQQPQTRTDPIKTLMMRHLDQTNGKGDFLGCIEFLLKDPDVDESDKGKILWTSYSGELQSATRKTMQNRFSECKKTWKSINQ